MWTLTQLEPIFPLTSETSCQFPSAAASIPVKDSNSNTVSEVRTIVDFLLPWQVAPIKLNLQHFLAKYVFEYYQLALHSSVLLYQVLVHSTPLPKVTVAS